LDLIDEYKPQSSASNEISEKYFERLIRDLFFVLIRVFFSRNEEEVMLNYERYRTLVQNDALESNLSNEFFLFFVYYYFIHLFFFYSLVTESECLKQIDLDEKFGPIGANASEKKPK